MTRHRHKFVRLSHKRQVDMAFWAYEYFAQVLEHHGVMAGHKKALDVLWGLAADRRVKVKYPADPYHELGTISTGSRCTCNSWGPTCPVHNVTYTATTINTASWPSANSNNASTNPVGQVES